MFILYRIAFAPAPKPYRIGLLYMFTHENRDFGAISATERSCYAPLSKVESHINSATFFTYNKIVLLWVDCRVSMQTDVLMDYKSAQYTVVSLES